MAITWNIHTLNHFWLEEMYSEWSLRREGRLHYQAYPPGLSTIVGLVPVTEEIVKKSLDRAKEELLNNDHLHALFESPSQYRSEATTSTKSSTIASKSQTSTLNPHRQEITSLSAVAKGKRPARSPHVATPVHMDGEESRSPVTLIATNETELEADPEQTAAAINCIASSSSSSSSANREKRRKLSEIPSSKTGGESYISPLTRARSVGPVSISPNSSISSSSRRATTIRLLFTGVSPEDTLKNVRNGLHGPCG
jgi:hypothetical protein